AFKAYPAASRHRRASYLVTSDGAERREIAARRPLGDARPIREADVWASMARNLARQPDTPAALELLERAHRIERGAARALQAGLRPAEQRAADGLVTTTLQRTWQRRRVAEHVAAAMTDRLDSLVQQQGRVLEALGRLAPAVRDAATHALAVMRPVLQQITASLPERRQAIQQQPEQKPAARPSRGPSPGM